jgi:AraC-like DNA-binding protein
VLVGANLPHYWQFDTTGDNDENELAADVSVIHFNQLFLGETFLRLPENKALVNLFERSKRGISLPKSAGKKIGPLIEKIVTAEGSRKIILLLEVLLAIGESKESRLMASIGFRNDFQEEEKDRINAIYNYSITNFKRNISLSEISTVANISPNSFCKFFKSRSRKTFSQFIREVRIGHACKLLIDDKLAIKEICYESGFNNFSSFHKYFKMIKGQTPLSYQKSFVKDSF